MLFLTLMMAVPQIAARNTPSPFKDWPRTGRPLPFAHPGVKVDPALRHYAIELGLSGRSEGSAPPILPDLLMRWTRGFRSAQPGVTVAIGPPYEPPQGELSAGIRRFIVGDSDFAFVTRDPADADLDAYRARHGRSPIVVAVGNGSPGSFGFVDPVVIVVHEDNPLRAITFEQIDALFSTTRHRGAAPLTRWRDLGVKAFGDRAINVVGLPSAQGESARALFLRRTVLSVGDRRGAWRANAVDSDDAVTTRVAGDRHAIGFTGLGHVQPGVRALAIAAQGRVAMRPDFASLAAGRYPLARSLYMLLRHDAARPTRAFARWIVSADGQRELAGQRVFLPLTARQSNAARTLLSKGE